VDGGVDVLHVDIEHVVGISFIRDIYLVIAKNIEMDYCNFH
jgi:hypothetical protein